MSSGPPGRRVDGVGVTRVTGDTQRSTGFSTHFGLTVVTAGAFEFWYRRRAWTQAPGTVKLKEPGEIHRDLRVLAPVTGTSIALAPTLMAAAAADLGRRAPPHFAAVIVADPAPLVAAVRGLDAALADVTRAPLEVDTRLAATLGLALGAHGEGSDRAPAPVPLPVRRARDFLEANLATTVRLDDLAAAVGLDKFHLIRSFGRTLGLPPYAYLTAMRVARARERLAAGQPPAAVAQAVGFYDQSQLHRHFVRAVGLSPGRYQRGVRPRG